VGYKGTLKSIQAELRRREREAQKQQRALERQQREYEKQTAIEQAAYDVQVHENYIDVLLSVHKEATDTVDWQWMLDAPEPVLPEKDMHRSDQARSALEGFVPTRKDKLIRRADTKRSELEQAVADAEAADEASYQQALQEHEAAVRDWEKSRALAQRILNDETDAFGEALTELGPFGDIAELGSNVEFTVETPALVDATVHVHGEEVVPNEVKSQLQSGKLSVKQMPIGRFYEIYQDYVCSCVLRVARETFALLPVHGVVVTAEDELLDAATGHVGPQPILSVAISRSTLDRLNFERIDPSDSLANFPHNMDFKKTKGFAPVDRLDGSALQV
jgi:hypothetical protein